MNGQMDVSFEIKALNKREFEGYGAIFGNVDRGGDVILPGAFTKSLGAHGRDGTLPQMLWMHDPKMVPGRWMAMSEDSAGLHVKGELADTTLGREMHTLLAMKAVRGLSIGYQTEDYGYDRSGHRQLKSVKLWEVSLVSLAMNPLASVDSVKSRLSSSGEYVPTEREFEHLVRDRMGVSKKVARFMTARLFDSGAGGMPDDPRRDADDVDPEQAKAMSDALAARAESLWLSAIQGRR